MDTLLVVILVVGIFVVLFAIDRSRSLGNQQRISLYLQSKGASNIEVRKVSFSGDRDNYVYDVTYADRLGRPRQVRCKINSSWLSDGEIFWSTPPEV